MQAADIEEGLRSGPVAVAYMTYDSFSDKNIWDPSKGEVRALPAYA